jgi:Ca-activated chloride channel homolog
MRRALLVVVAFGVGGATWLDPHRTAREASRLYADGKFDDAASKYNEALVDDPDSALLHYNVGATAYRRGKFDEAAAAWASVAAAEQDAKRTAAAAYDLGNAIYRSGAAAEGADPKKALELYAQALVAYRRAMGADPGDEDAKFNHELVEKKLADLKKKLEEQQKQDQQQQQDQQQDQQQNQDQQQQQGQQEQQKQQQDQQQQPEEQQAGQQPPDQKQEEKQADAEPSGQGAGGETAGAPDEKMAPRDAQALLDGERDQEVRPDEVVKQLQGAGVAEPREDW